MTTPDLAVPPAPAPTDSLTWRPLRFLTFYRVILAGLLATLFFALPELRPLGSNNPHLFAVTILSYLGFGLATSFTTRWRRPGYRLQVYVQIFADVVAITLLMDASGGLQSGLGILLAVAVAAGSLLLPGRSAYGFAALATLAVLGEHGYHLLSDSAVDSGSYTHAGLLGATFFATAVLTNMLARRVQESEALAAQRGIDLANMAQLNDYVIQHLEGGVLVVDNDNRVRLMNDPAWQLLGMPGGTRDRSLEELSPALLERLRAWRLQPGREPEAFRTGGGEHALLPRFTRLGAPPGAATLVLLEDTAALAQRVQQMKLASLGRLTASIAHEIRNPLGAISHAGQLLGESTALDSGDLRLIRIIHEQSERVNTIVENVLQLSRRDPTRVQDIPLEPWLQKFGEEFTGSEAIAPGRFTIAIAPADTRVSFDPTHLHQVLWNLCQNGLEHGGQPPRLELRGGVTQDSGGPFLDVIDNGSGIDADAEQHIFEPFYTTKRTGTGLGLYLSRELCECNRARLSYHPVPAGGSCFRITFSTTGTQD